MNARFTIELARWGPDVSTDAPTRKDAQSYCRRLAGSHYENFTVASWLLPSELRQHVCNVYAYCRWADDLADEVGDAEESLRLLDWWASELECCVARPSSHPVFLALAETITRFDLPLEPFTDLLAAFRLDQVKRRYESFEELLEYCRCSANPVGRIVLGLGEVEIGAPEAEWSDAICTGLQLANFCQDVASDFRVRDRIYLPRESRERFAVSEEDFHRGADNERFRELLRFEVERAEQFLARGAPLMDRVPQWLRVDLRLFIGGGRAILQRIRDVDYRVWTARPSIGKWTKLRLLTRAYLASLRPEASR